MNEPRNVTGAQHIRRWVVGMLAIAAIVAGIWVTSEPETAEDRAADKRVECANFEYLVNNAGSPGAAAIHLNDMQEAGC